MEECRYSESCNRARRTRPNFCYLEDLFFVQEHANDLLPDLDDALELNKEHIGINSIANDDCPKKVPNTSRLAADRMTLDRLYREKFFK